MANMTVFDVIDRLRAAWRFKTDPVPEEAEGITACVWHPLDEARQTVSYDNARDVLRQAAEMQLALVQT